MSKVREVHWRDIYSERIWRCDCGGPHFIRIARPIMVDDGDDDFYQYLSFETFTRAEGLRERIKVAWQVLRGQSWCDGDLHLDAKTAREVCEDLSKAATEYEAWEKRNSEKEAYDMAATERQVLEEVLEQAERLASKGALVESDVQEVLLALSRYVLKLGDTLGVLGRLDARG